MSTYHVFGRRTVAATWAAYSSYASLDDAIVAARDLTKSGRVNEAIIVNVLRDYTAAGCTKSFSADEIESSLG